MMIIAASNLINLALKTWVFTKADHPDYYEVYPATIDPKTSASSTAEDRERFKQDQEDRYQIQKQSEAINFFSMLLVATPVFFFHWRLAKKDKEEKEN
jgi:hypothetical protein